MRTVVILAAFVGLSLVCGFASAQPTLPREGDKKLPFKTRYQFYNNGMVGQTGVVTAIDKDSLTLTWNSDRTGKEENRTFQALDLHKRGEYHEWASGAHSYRWADVKKGDTVHVEAQKDPADGTVYAINLCIYRRPGGKLPESQDPKEDRRYKSEYLLNEIDNGEDVAEEEIRKAFPEDLDRRTGLVRNPGGLTLDYRTRLSAIRDKKEAEKKAKDLKAKPPEKK